MPEERKLVTVLFADIVGSSQHGLAHDPEVVRATLSSTFDALRTVLVAHGGTVEKFIGDAVMAVFGVPQAHDDDPDRAVRAAFALRGRISQLNERSRMPMELRVGVNTGEAVSGSGENAQFLVTGVAVNAASRLQSAAAPGEILVGTLTRQLTPGVRYGERRRIEAKGLGAIDVWPALQLESAVPEQHRGLAALRSPLIGRDRELRILEDAFARVRASGAPALAAVFGAAGAGKSRLTSEFIERIGSDRVRAGRCLPYGEGITFYALQLILRAECGIEPTDDHDAAMSKLERSVAQVFEVDEEARAVSARVATLAGLTQARDALPTVAEADLAEELRWGLRRFFERRAATKPLVLVFEDLHWAEPALVEVIEHLAEWSRAPLLLLCLARPDFRDSHVSFGGTAANATTLTLAPLALEDTRRLIQELLAVDALPETFRAEVVTRAEGNPLYIEEFLRSLIETGKIERRDRKWVAVGDVSTLDVPPTLIGLIAARLDRVSPEVKHVLQRASLVGRLFSTSGLEAIGGERVPAELLREAVRRDLLSEADERALGEGRVYRFKHVLIRDVAYSTVPKADRARMHSNYARWLESSLGDRREEYADVIAFHAEQAFLFAHELGQPDAEALGQTALQRLLVAATRARRRGDPRGALKLYERAARAADLCAASLSLEAEAYGYTAILAWRLRTRSADAGERLDAVLPLVQEAGPSEVLSEMFGLLGRRAAQSGEYAAAERFFQQQVDVATATGDTELVGEALVDRAFSFDLLGDFRRYYEGMLETRQYLSETGASRALQRCLTGLARVSFFRGEFTISERYRAEAAEVQSNGRSAVAIDLIFASHLYYECGQLDEAMRLAGAALESALEAGVQAWIGLAHWCFGEPLLERGDAKAAAAAFEQGIGVFQALDARGQLPEVHARFARAAIRLGDLHAARVHVEAARATLLPADPESEQMLEIARAELAAADGNSDEAEKAYRDAVTRTESSGHEYKTAQTRLLFGEWLVQAKRWREGERELQLARSFYRDALAAPRRAQIDALLAKCEVAAQ